MSVRGARGDGAGGEGRGRRDLPGRRARGRAVARRAVGRSSLGAHRHPAGGVERAADLVRGAARAHPRLHRRQRRHVRRQEPRLPSRHLPRSVRPAVAGTAVARHDPARPQGADRAARRAHGRRPRWLHGVAEVRREGARRAALGRGAALGRDPVLGPGLPGRAGRAVPRRDGGGGPRTAAARGRPARRPARAADARTRPASSGVAGTARYEVLLGPAAPSASTLPWFTPDADPGTAGRLSAPHDDNPTSPATPTRKGPP